MANLPDQTPSQLFIPTRWDGILDYRKLRILGVPQAFFGGGEMRLLFGLCMLSAARIHSNVECLPRSFSKEYFNPCRPSRHLHSVQVPRAMVAITKTVAVCAPRILVPMMKSIDSRALPPIAKSYCLAAVIFYNFHGDERARLPPRLYQNGSAIFALVDPLFKAIASAGKKRKCLRIGVDKVCFNRREVIYTLMDAIRCYLTVTRGIGMQTVEEQLLIVKYILDRLY